MREWASTSNEIIKASRMERADGKEETGKFGNGAKNRKIGNGAKSRKALGGVRKIMV
jgi:hypothetical protein